MKQKTGILLEVLQVKIVNCGTTFLDEFPEFERRSIEALRQPLEDGMICVSRARGSLVFPARFIMVCTTNPCPCGNMGSKKPCVCSQAALMRYQRKISGPIIDRIDLWLEVPQVEHEKLSDNERIGETSKDIQKRITKAREIQKRRFFKRDIFTNSEMNVREIKMFANLSDNVKNILNQAAQRLDLSGRAYHRVIKLSRTIADLEGSQDIKESHILEALQYRPK